MNTAVVVRSTFDAPLRLGVKESHAKAPSRKATFASKIISAANELAWCK